MNVLVSVVFIDELEHVYTHQQKVKGSIINSQ